MVSVNKTTVDINSALGNDNFMPFYAVYNLQEFRKNALISSTEKQVGDTE
jgi:hypothetical protein